MRLVLNCGGAPRRHEICTIAAIAPRFRSAVTCSNNVSSLAGQSQHEGCLSCSVGPLLSRGCSPIVRLALKYFQSPKMTSGAEKTSTGRWPLWTRACGLEVSFCFKFYPSMDLSVQSTAEGIHHRRKVPSLIEMQI